MDDSSCDMSQIEASFEIIQYKSKKKKKIMMYFFHIIHYLFVFYVLFAISPYNSLMSVTVLISWELNEDFCILSQIEEQFFEMTFIFTTTAKKVTRHQKIFILVIHFLKLYYLLCWL